MASHRQASFFGSRHASFSSTVSLPGSATERPATSLIFDAAEVADAGLSPDTTVLVGKKSTLTSLLDDAAAIGGALGVEGDLEETPLSIIKAAFQSIGGKSGSASTFVPSSGGGGGSIQKVAFVALPDTVTRNNHPMSVHSLTDSLGRVTPGKGDVKVVVATGGDEAVTAGSIGLAVAKAFPLYSRKTKGGKPKDDADRSIAVTLLDGSFQPVTNEDAIAAMSAAAEGARLAARLVDTPPEELTTTAFAAEAAAIAEALGGSVTYDEIVGDELFEKGYGGLHAVGRCAVEPPRLVMLSYEPQATTAETQTFALVGKGIIYDTGGLSLKPKTGMCGMKGDMGGAAGLLGAFSAAVNLGVPHKITLLLCLAENAIGPSAFRNDDILTMLSGKTVEVNNCDAEGRLVLADGVNHATKYIESKSRQRVVDLIFWLLFYAVHIEYLHPGILTARSLAHTSTPNSLRLGLRYRHGHPNWGAAHRHRKEARWHTIEYRGP